MVHSFKDIKCWLVLSLKLCTKHSYEPRNKVGVGRVAAIGGSGSPEPTLPCSMEGVVSGYLTIKEPGRHAHKYAFKLDVMGQHKKGRERVAF